MKELHVDSIRKSYDGKLILSDIYLKCNPGEIVGLLGRNGAGKSSLLKIIFGTEKAENKYIRVGGKVIRTLADGRRLINYLPQENFLPKGVRIKRLIELFLTAEDAVSVLAHQAIKPLLKKRFEELSGGEKRVVEILLIINSNAEFILLDEPFTGLSPILRDEVCTYIQNNASKKGFVISDHDYENMSRLCNRILLLKDGYLKEVQNTSALTELGYLPVKNLKNDLFKR